VGVLQKIWTVLVDQPVVMHESEMSLKGNGPL
jgi:hypothetical protein